MTNTEHFEIWSDAGRVSDPWGGDAWRTPQEAFDAFLRVLDAHGCVPGWVALGWAHEGALKWVDVRLNGFSLVVKPG